METIKLKELQRLAFCNSNELLGKQFLFNGVPHEWVGIGFVECGEKKEPMVNVLDSN